MAAFKFQCFWLVVTPSIHRFKTPSDPFLSDIADDSSPLISYSPAGAWTDSPINDLSGQLYSRKTWHTTSLRCASATIHFNGTGIWFFGAKRPGYGTYNISLDGQSVSGNARSETVSFQQLLGGLSGLANGPHTAAFTNTGLGSAVDLDSIVFETQIGSASATVTNTTTDDISPAINYLPSSGDWVLTHSEGCFDNTLHFTQSKGAQAQFTFDGDAVAVYGTVSPVHTNYAVTVDGAKRDFLVGGSNGLLSGLHEDTLLYFSNNLAPQSHNLTLTANPGQPNTGTFMDIDRITVFTVPNSTNSTSPNGIMSQSDPGSTAQNSGGNSVNKVPHDPNVSRRLNPVVIGAVVAGTLILMLLLLIVLALVLIRRRRRRAQQNKTHPKLAIRSPMTPSLPIQMPGTSGISPRSPTESKTQNPFCDPSDIENGLAPPLSIVRSMPDGNPFADNVETKSPPVRKTSVMQASRDDRRAGGSRNQSNVSSAPVRPPRPQTLKLPPELGG